MSSVGEDCNELKQQYDACFNSWFSERFLKGQTDDSACAPIPGLSGMRQGELIGSLTTYGLTNL